MKYPLPPVLADKDHSHYYTLLKQQIQAFEELSCKNKVEDRVKAVEHMNGIAVLAVLCRDSFSRETMSFISKYVLTGEVAPTTPVPRPPEQESTTEKEVTKP